MITQKNGLNVVLVELCTYACIHRQRKILLLYMQLDVGDIDNQTTLDYHN